MKSGARSKVPPFRRINLPNRKRRDRLKELERASPRESFVEADVETASEASSEQDYSYEFAQMEVIMKTLGNNGTVGIIFLLPSTLSFVLPGHSGRSAAPPPPTAPTIFRNSVICFAVYGHYSETLLFVNLLTFNLDNHNSSVLMFNQSGTVVNSAFIFKKKENTANRQMVPEPQGHQDTSSTLISFFVVWYLC